MGAAFITNYIGSHDFIPSWTTFDAQVNVNVPWNAKVSLGVRNLANKIPPLSTAYGSPFYDNSLYNMYGRVPYIRYEQSF